MLVIGTMLLMSVGAHTGTELQLPNTRYVSLMPSYHSLIQQSGSPSVSTDVAQSYKSNCDKIRAISNRLKLGLSNSEIEYLGSGRHLLMNRSRLDLIHQKFKSASFNITQHRLTPNDRIGEIWFTPGRSSSLLHDHLNTQRAANKANKSTVNLDSTYSSHFYKTTPLAQAGGDAFNYNLPSGQCVCYTYANGSYSYQ